MVNCWGSPSGVRRPYFDVEFAAGQEEAFWAWKLSLRLCAGHGLWSCSTFWLPRVIQGTRTVRSWQSYRPGMRRRWSPGRTCLAWSSWASGAVGGDSLAQGQFRRHFRCAADSRCRELVALVGHIMWLPYVAELPFSSPHLPLTRGMQSESLHEVTDQATTPLQARAPAPAARWRSKT